MADSEFQGRTAAEAAIRACEALGLTRSQIEFDVISDEGDGLDRIVRIVVKTSAAEREGDVGGVGGGEAAGPPAEGNGLEGVPLDLQGDTQHFLYCRNSDYSELGSQSLIVAAAVFPTVQNGTIQHFHMAAYGFDGTSQSDQFIRVDFEADGTVMSRVSDMGSDSWFVATRYTISEGAPVEIGSSWDTDLPPGQLSKSVGEVAIESRLTELLMKSLEWRDEGDWLAVREEIYAGMNLVRDEPGRSGRRELRSPGFDPSFYVGLAQPGSFLPFIFALPRDLAQLRASLAAYGGARRAALPDTVPNVEQGTRTRFVFAAYSEELDRAQSGTVEEAEKGAVAESLWPASVLNPIAEKVGLEIVRFFVDWHSLEYTVVATGEGTLYDYDKRFLEASRTFDTHIDVSDIDNLLSQSYECGEHEEGSVSDPHDAAGYTEEARLRREQILAKLAQG